MPFTLRFQSFPAPTGPLSYAYVPWDSELYGFPFYELICETTSLDALAEHLAPWLSSLPTDRPCMAYAKVAVEEVSVVIVLTDRGFYSIETLLQLDLPLARLVSVAHRPFTQSSLRLATEADLPDLRQIAASAFSADRLHLDPHLPSKKASQRYARWVEHGFRAGELVFVYPDPCSNTTIGFIHVREVGPKTVDLSLGAMNKAHQGTGHGALMYQAVLTECRARGYKFATGRVPVTNLPMVNLLARLGFRIRSAVATLHWFRPAR